MMWGFLFCGLCGRTAEDNTNKENIHEQEGQIHCF